MSAKDKAYMESLGSKEHGVSTEAVLSSAKAKMKDVVPGFLDYSKKFRPEKICDRTGWSVRPENKKIFGGK